jgi:hypothetical protein
MKRPKSPSALLHYQDADADERSGDLLAAVGHSLRKSLAEMGQEITVMGDMDQAGVPRIPAFLKKSNLALIQF